MQIFSFRSYKYRGMTIDQPCDCFGRYFCALLFFIYKICSKGWSPRCAFFASSLHRRIPLYSELSAGVDAEAVQLEPADAAAGGSDAPPRGGGFAAFTPRSQQARLFFTNIYQCSGSMTIWCGSGSMDP